jgi:uncharacterized repeat protein (TIGR03803 family)
VLFGAAAIASSAQVPDTLVNFDGTNGGEPDVSLIQGTDGNLWGTTLEGGATYIGGINQGYGEVFNMTPSGALTTVYSFCSQTNCTDGSFPYAPLVQGTDGNYYGTTQGGGAYNNGSVFKLTPQGELTTLHSFCHTQGCSDGTNIYAGLVLASNGDFYGMAQEGGTGSGCGCGTVFKITPAGTLTTVHNFAGPDGSAPVAALIQVSSGLFYGMTSTGGAHNQGTVFKMTAGGTITTLYSFCAQSGCTDGSSPQDSLVQGYDGNFYGTTYLGGSSDAGTVFKITPKGVLTTLYSFSLDAGYHPQSSLIQATDGNFYGTTYTGDGDQCGAGCVFEITSAGTLTNIVDFATEAEGLQPIGGVTQDTSGNLYGSTYHGGSFGEGADSGTLFEAVTGLGSFVTITPTHGKVAAKVTILGTDLTGTTAVTFNGTAATFTVVSASEMTTSVPTGTTSGFVAVTTPGGTLTSNVPFMLGSTLIPTTTTLSSSQNPSTSGEAVTFTAIVSPNPGAPSNGETVTFKKGATVLGTGTLNGGSASFTTSTLPVGTTDVKAVYGTDAYFKGSTSNAVKQVVDKAAN